MKEPKFKDYKEKQEFYKERSKKILSRYDSGKRYSKSGKVRIKGIPFVNEEKQRIKEKRRLRKLARKYNKESE